MRLCVVKLLEQRRMKMPWLQAAAKELDMLKDEVEADARKFVEEDIGAARTRKAAVFGSAKKRVKDIGEGIEEFNTFLTALDQASNSPPTSGASETAAEPPPVNAQPSETAALPEAK